MISLERNWSTSHYCDGLKALSHFRDQDDDESGTYTFVHFINSRDRPWTTLMAIGFDYGANMLTEYPAEVGEDTQTSYQDASIELGKEWPKAEGELTGNTEAIKLILDNVSNIEKRGEGISGAQEKDPGKDEVKEENGTWVALAQDPTIKAKKLLQLRVHIHLSNSTIKTKKVSVIVPGINASYVTAEIHESSDHDAIIGPEPEGCLAWLWPRDFKISILSAFVAHFQLFSSEVLQSLTIPNVVANLPGKSNIEVRYFSRLDHLLLLRHAIL
ncbi:hypothetical protein Tco_0110792 [Tanacetum coccineum]